MQDDIEEDVLNEFKLPPCIEPAKELEDDAVIVAEEHQFYQIEVDKINLKTITDSEIETMEMVSQKREQQLIRQEVIAKMNERQIISRTIPIDGQLCVSFLSFAFGGLSQFKIFNNAIQLYTSVQMRNIELANEDLPEHGVLGKQGQVDIFSIDACREPHLIITRELPNSLLRQLSIVRQHD